MYFKRQLSEFKNETISFGKEVETLFYILICRFHRKTFQYHLANYYHSTTTRKQPENSMLFALRVFTILMI